MRDLVRDEVIARLGDRSGVLVVDETGFLKKGRHSVGVARQYSGTAGRVENCQVGVFWSWSYPGSVDTFPLEKEGPSMPKSHAAYAPEFRRQMVELVRSGRTAEDLSREFEPTAQSIWNWVRQADRDDGRRQDGATSSEREELTRLRRENRQLRQERDILAKAAAWFARETAVIPSGSSNS